MLRIAFGLVVLALLAAFLGFGGFAGLAFDGAQMFFFGFIILAILGLIFGSRFLRS